MWVWMRKNRRCAGAWQSLLRWPMTAEKFCHSLRLGLARSIAVSPAIPARHDVSLVAADQRNARITFGQFPLLLFALDALRQCVSGCELERGRARHEGLQPLLQVARHDPALPRVVVAIIVKQKQTEPCRAAPIS